MFSLTYSYSFLEVKYRFVKMNKILVTGSNGFLGSFIVEELLKRNFEVKCLVRKTSNLRWIKNLPVEFIYGEITKPETLEAAVKDTSYIFHVAAIKRALVKEDYYRVNQEGTANLLNAASKYCKDFKR